MYVGELRTKIILVAELLHIQILAENRDLVIPVNEWNKIIADINILIEWSLKVYYLITWSLSFLLLA